MFELETSEVYEDIPIPQTRIINVGLDTTNALMGSSDIFSESSFTVKVKNDDRLGLISDFTPRNMDIIELVSPAHVV